MVLGGPLDGKDLFDRSLLEPRELLVRNREFLLAQENPEPVRRDVGDLSFQSGASQ